MSSRAIVGTRLGRRLTIHERERRRDACVQLWNAGYSRDAICVALSIGHGTLADDLTARRIPRAPNRVHPRTDPPPTIIWRDNPEEQKSMPGPPPRPRSRPASESRVIEDVPRWEQSRTHQMMRLFVESFDGDRLANEFAHAMFAATLSRDAGDDDAGKAMIWLAQVHQLILTLNNNVQQLLWIEHDTNYRDQCMASSRPNVPLPMPSMPLRSVS